MRQLSGEPELVNADRSLPLVVILMVDVMLLIFLELLLLLLLLLLGNLLLLQRPQLVQVVVMLLVWRQLVLGQAGESLLLSLLRVMPQLVVALLRKVVEMCIGTVDGGRWIAVVHYNIFGLGSCGRLLILVIHRER